MPPSPTGAPRRNRTKRLQLIAALCGAAVMLAIWSLGQAWFTMSLAPVTLIDADNQTYENVSASASITGWGLAKQTEVAPTPAFGPPTAAPALPIALGMPLGVTMLVIAGALGVIAMLCRATLVGGLAMICIPMAWRQHGAVAKIMLDPYMGGALNKPGPGPGTFQLALMLVAGFILVGTVQCYLVNAEARAEAKAAALARGETPTPGVLDTVSAMVAGQMGRFAKGPAAPKTATHR